mmetsp:Transcript_18916/g.72144  ORF Transcript_18916/g.72144 Transcript_18916/m.72144 type:complete len:223 (-) Transcript_18916:255-923(-)
MLRDGFASAVQSRPDGVVDNTHTQSLLCRRVDVALRRPKHRADGDLHLAVLDVGVQRRHIEGAWREANSVQKVVAIALVLQLRKRPDEAGSRRRQAGGRRQRRQRSIANLHARHLEPGGVDDACLVSRLRCRSQGSAGGVYDLRVRRRAQRPGWEVWAEDIGGCDCQVKRPDGLDEPGARCCEHDCAASRSHCVLAGEHGLGAVVEGGAEKKCHCHDGSHER